MLTLKYLYFRILHSLEDFIACSKFTYYQWNFIYKHTEELWKRRNNSFITYCPKWGKDIMFWKRIDYNSKRYCDILSEILKSYFDKVTIYIFDCKLIGVVCPQERFCGQLTIKSKGVVCRQEHYSSQIINSGGVSVVLHQTPMFNKGKIEGEENQAQLITRTIHKLSLLVENDTE